MAYHISKEKKLRVVDLLNEGLGIRPIVRITGVPKNTVKRIILRTAECSRRFNREALKNLRCDFIQADELHTFVYSKNRYEINEEAGIFWIFVALDPKSKLAIHYHVGKRTALHAQLFVEGLKKKLSHDTQISTDKLSSYVRAISETNAMGDWSENAAAYLGHTRTLGVLGRGATNHVETHNNRLRSHISFLRRKTQGFSKSLAHLRASLDRYFFFYNFCRIHGSLSGKTPAMAHGIISHKMNFEMLFASENEPYFVPSSPRTLYNRKYMKEYRKHPLSFDYESERNKNGLHERIADTNILPPDEFLMNKEEFNFK